jgi:hypothetical protein
MITGRSFDHPVFFISHLAVLCPLLCEVDRGLSFPSIWLLPSRLFLSAVLASTSFFTEWPYMVIKYVKIFIGVNMLSLKIDGELLVELSEKCRELRLRQNMSQQEVSERAGIALRTYRRFEQEGQISLERFVAVVRALNRLSELEGLLRVPSVRDIRELDNQPAPRKRAGRKP